MFEVRVVIPLAIGPMERMDRFEDAICDLLEEEDTGELVGSGTYGDKAGIVGVSMQIDVASLSVMNRIVPILRSGGAPPESIIKFTDESREIYLRDWVDIT